jgi:DNA-binding transcriptional MerR regulator
MRITPKFENNYDIDLMLKMVDRVRAIGLTWKQVKDFVKVNLTDFENKTVADKAKQKAMDHLKDQSDKRAADLPDSSVKVKKLSNEPQKDGDTLAKDQVKDEDDLPHKPMKTAKTPKRQAEYGESKPKAPKHDNDKELVKKMPGKKRS